jgi:predicted small integral membrane protein
VGESVLVGAVAFYMTLVVFNNLSDYGSCWRFAHHVRLTPE